MACPQFIHRKIIQKKFFGISLKINQKTYKRLNLNNKKLFYPGKIGVDKCAGREYDACSDAVNTHRSDNNFEQYLMTDSEAPLPAIRGKFCLV